MKTRRARSRQRRRRSLRKKVYRGGNGNNNKPQSDLNMPVNVHVNVPANLAASNFKIITFPNKSVIYHGTNNYLQGGKPFPPGYFSTDPLQAIGHSLVKFQAFYFNCLKKYNKDFSKCIMNNGKLNREEINRIRYITSCFPFLYSFIFNKDSDFLFMTNPSDYDNSFGKLFNKNKMLEYLHKIPGKIQLLEKVRSRILGIKMGKNNVEFNKEITNANFNHMYNVILDLYLQNCNQSCFGGWTNTPGYTLLNGIDYNAYLKEIGLINEKDFIKGIFVERDQDEIILFENTCIDMKNIHIVFPFSLKNEESHFVEFFLNYTKTVLELKPFIQSDNELLRLFESNVNVNVANKQNILDKLKELFDFSKQLSSYVRNGEEKLWNLDWFKTNCPTYNPHVPIKNQVNSTNNTKCKTNIRYPLDEIKAAILENTRFANIVGTQFLSSKLSIEDETQLDDLNEYLNMVINFNFDEYLKKQDPHINIDTYFTSICSGAAYGLNRKL